MVSTSDPDPWTGRTVTWRIDGEEFTAPYNPGELKVMAIAKERGVPRRHLECVHLCKAIIPDTHIIDSDARHSEARTATNQPRRALYTNRIPAADRAEMWREEAA